MSLAADAKSERARLCELSAFLRRGLRSNGFYTAGVDSQIVPVILGPSHVAVHFADYLRTRGFGVRPIRPPTVPPGSARLRLSVTANHSEDILADLLVAMVQARNEYSAARAASVFR
jgi:7-keto-8-aminopelargonate synthetase-like enzyme